MTIQEAIRSGRPFRRECELEDAWMFVDNASGRFCMENEKYNDDEGNPQPWNELTRPDILAEDWIIKEEPCSQQQ